MAEAYFRRLIERSGRKDLECGSAGLCASQDSPASRNAVAVMKTYGIDLSSHRSRPFSGTLAKDADLIIVMTSAHLSSALALFPEISGKIKTLAPSGDIADPFGGDEKVYHACFEEMKGHLENLFLDLISHKDK